MKKLLIAIISIVLLLTLCSCDTDSCLKFKLKDDGTYSVSAKATAFFCEDIVIPDTVTQIGANNFVNCKNVTLYCEASAKPDTWYKDWNLYVSGNYYLPVIWGYAVE